MLFWLRLFGVITDINNTMIISVSIHALLQIILSRAGGGGKGYIQLPISDIGKCFCNQYHTEFKVLTTVS